MKTSERVVLTIEVDAPKGWKADPVSLEGALPEGWNVLRTGAAKTTPIAASASAGGEGGGGRGGGGGERTSFSFELEPFLPGKAEIKPLKVVLRPNVIAKTGTDAKSSAGGPAPDAAPITLETTAVPVEVLSVLPEGAGGADAELAEIKGVVDPRTPTNWWLIGGVAFGVAAIGALAWMIAARLRRAAAERVVTRAAHEIALERLDRLMARGLLTPGRERFKDFFDGASAVLREYIEDRFALRAPERTTDEFLRDARASAKLSENDVEALGRFLNECDMVKFAKAQPKQEDGERAAGIVREFIVKTRATEATIIVSGPGAVRGPRLAAADEPAARGDADAAREGATA
ncbi:MAG: hypothetical protein ACKVZJ_08020 [Phycisphaerales bacterium]